MKHAARKDGNRRVLEAEEDAWGAGSGPRRGGPDQGLFQGSGASTSADLRGANFDAGILRDASEPDDKVSIGPGGWAHLDEFQGMPPG